MDSGSPVYGFRVSSVWIQGLQCMDSECIQCIPTLRMCQHKQCGWQSKFTFLWAHHFCSPNSCKSASRINRYPFTSAAQLFMIYKYDALKEHVNTEQLKLDAWTPGVLFAANVKYVLNLENISRELGAKMSFALWHKKKWVLWLHRCCKSGFCSEDFLSKIWEESLDHWLL